MTKDQLRDAIKLKRESIHKSDLKAQSRIIFKKLIEHPEVLNAERIHIYLSKSEEVDTFLFLEWLLTQEKHVLTSALKGGEMVHQTITKDSKIGLGVYDIPVNLHPKDSFKTAELNLDVVIVPLLAADYNLNRVGYGGGYYDRFLASQNLDKAYKIGLAFDFQVFSEVPSDPWDVSLDELISIG